ncbi:MAG: response regulator [Verrucomicrobia bacterium]|nr:response regulator [Verrucomicrobiota bacterium]
MSKNRLSSLRVRLMLIVALAVSPALLMVAHTSWQARRLAELRAETDARRLAEFAATQQRQAIESARKTLAQLATQVIRGNPKSVKSDFLDRRVGYASPFLNVAVTDARGRVIVSTAKLTNSASIGDQPWFDRLMHVGKFAVENTSTDPVTGTRGLVCAVPLDPPDRERTGVIYAALRMTWVRDLAKTSDFDDGTRLEVFDSAGVRFAATSGATSNAPDFVLPRHLAAQLPQRGDTRVLMENGDADNDTWLRVIHHLPGATPSADSFIIVSVPAAKLAAAAHDRRVRDGVLLLVIVGLALALAWISGERLVLRRTRALVDAAERLRDGDLSARTGMAPAHTHGDEIGELARKFDAMAERLQTEQRERLQLEEQVRIAQKMEAMGLLAGGVAHDFNNLLQIIAGSAQLAQQLLPADSPAEAHLANARQAAERGAQLTRQLLAMTRQQPLDRLPVELNELVTSLLQMIRRVIGAHIQVTFTPEPQPAWANADRGQIEQLFLNLCLNARDAMPDGGQLELRALTIEVAANDPLLSGVRPGTYHELSVKDTGMGIAPENLARIFDPFFTTKPKDRGTGLGLSVAYGIIRQHEGHIRVESEPRFGSTFFVLLPQIAPPADAECPAATAAKQPGGTETILVVEDEDLVRELSVHLLEQAGYKVLSVSNGAEACDIFAKHAGQIALVMLDVIMPRMGGREAARRIRELSSTVPVVFCSGYSGPALEQGQGISKDESLLTKPYRAEEFLRKVRESLDLATAHAEEKSAA